MKNFHTHTYRCKHASGDVEHYAEEACETGITALGISDHAPLPDNRWPEIRMDMSELREYLASIDRVKDKYQGLRIYKGLECEYDTAYENYYRDELLGKYKLDYLIGGVHFFPSKDGWQWCVSSIKSKEDMRVYAEFYVTSMKSGLFNFMAHPDFFGISYPEWDSEAIACSKYILEAAKDMGIPLEINVSGLVKEKIRTSIGERPAYPVREFWRLAGQYGISAVVSSDAHSPAHLTANLKKGFELAEEFGVKLIDPERVIMNRYLVENAY